MAQRALLVWSVVWQPRHGPSLLEEVNLLVWTLWWSPDNKQGRKGELDIKLYTEIFGF